MITQNDRSTSLKPSIPPGSEPWPGATEPQSSPEEAHTETRSVLLVDDNSVYRHSVHGVLTKLHFNVQVATDGAQAWAILQQPDAPSLVILDWMMPGMDGYEVCRRVRNAKGDWGPYILLVTAKDSREDLLRAIVAGADDYLIKPFKVLDLEIRLRVALRVLALKEQVRAMSLT